MKPSGFIPPKKSPWEKLTDLITRLKPRKMMTEEEKKKVLKKY